MTGGNVQRRPLRRDNTSGFKGVTSWGDKWRACIRDRHGVRNLHLGLYGTPEAAARAYDVAALALYGPDAWTNAAHGLGAS